MHSISNLKPVLGFVIQAIDITAANSVKKDVPMFLKLQAYGALLDDAIMMSRVDFKQVIPEAKLLSDEALRKEAIEFFADQFKLPNEKIEKKIEVALELVSAAIPLIQSAIKIVKE